MLHIKMDHPNISIYHSTFSPARRLSPSTNTNTQCNQSLSLSLYTWILYTNINIGDKYSKTIPGPTITLQSSVNYYTYVCYLFDFFLMKYIAYTYIRSDSICMVNLLGGDRRAKNKHFCPMTFFFSKSGWAYVLIEVEYFEFTFPSRMSTYRPALSYLYR